MSLTEKITGGMNLINVVLDELIRVFIRYLLLVLIVAAVVYFLYEKIKSILSSPFKLLGF